MAERKKDKKEDDSGDEPLNDIIQKKTRSKTKKSTRKSKKDENDETVIENEDNEAIEDNDVAEVQNTSQFGSKFNNGNRPKIVIDPETPIKDLNTFQILTYLINVGSETLNPQLKYGSINLLNNLKGNNRNRYNNNNYRRIGSKVNSNQLYR